MVVTSGGDSGSQRQYVLQNPQAAGARDIARPGDQARRVQVRQTRVHQLRGAGLSQPMSRRQQLPRIHTIHRNVLVQSPSGGIARLTPRATLVFDTVTMAMLTSQTTAAAGRRCRQQRRTTAATG